MNFERRSTIQAPASDVFAWHLFPGAFERLTPPNDGTRVVERTGSIEADTMRLVLSVPVIGPIRQRWHVRHEGFVAGEQFVDVMERGPFKHWRHTHTVRDLGGGQSELIDSIEYELPMGILGRIFGGPLVRRKLDKMFEYRHAVTRADLEGGSSS